MADAALHDFTNFQSIAFIYGSLLNQPIIASLIVISLDCDLTHINSLNFKGPLLYPDLEGSRYLRN